MDDGNLESITIRVSADMVEDILSMMEPDIGEVDTSKLVAEFALMSFQHFYEWLSGRKRHRTLTEQYIEWMEQIYTRLLPEEEVPSYSRLYNKFNIPYGQAGYIIRVLNERELPHLRASARLELETALHRVQSDAETAIRGGKPDQLLSVKLSSLSNRELRNIANTLHRRDDSTLLPKERSTYGGIKTVMVPALTVGKVLAELETQENHTEG